MISQKKKEMKAIYLYNLDASTEYNFLYFKIFFINFELEILNKNV